MRSVWAFAMGLALLGGCGPVDTPDNDNANSGDNGNTSNDNDNDNGMSTADQPAIEVGFGDPFVALEDGDGFLVSRGFQGLMDAFVTFRLLNFPADTTARLNIVMELTDTEELTQVVNLTADLTFTEIEPGINELSSGLTIASSPANTLGRPARLTVNVDTVTGDPTSASYEQNVVFVEAP